MAYEYEGTRRVGYGHEGEGIAQFVPVCPKCGRFVKADDTLMTMVNGLDEVKMPDTNATCAKCGRVSMPFEGYF